MDSFKNMKLKYSFKLMYKVMRYYGLDEFGYFRSLLYLDKDKKSDWMIAPTEISSVLFVLRSGMFRKYSDLEDDLIRTSKNHFKNGRFNFFKDKVFPDDTETTAYGVSTLLELNQINKRQANKSLDQILDTKNSDGVVQIYYSPEKFNKKNQVDYIALANILSLGYKLKRRNELKISEEFMLDSLNDKGLVESRYYPQPEFLLYFLSTDENLLIKHSQLIKDLALKSETYESFETCSIRNFALHKQSKHWMMDWNKQFDSNRSLVINFQYDMTKSKPVFSYGDKRAYFDSPTITASLAYQALRSL